MIVSDKDDANDGNARPIDGAIFAGRNRFVIRFEYESPAPFELDRELTDSIADQGMWMASHKIRDIRRVPEVSEPCSEFSCARSTKPPFRDSLLLTQLAEIPVFKSYLHGGRKDTSACRSLNVSLQDEKTLMGVQ
jgi:hypothetical protein